MKKQILLALLMLGVSAVRAQNNAVLIADETGYTEQKRAVKVATFNDSIYNMLLREERRHLIKVTTYYNDHDDPNSEIHWTLFFKLSAKEEIKAFFKRHKLSSE